MTAIPNRQPRYSSPHIPPYERADQLPAPPTSNEDYNAAYRALAKTKRERNELIAKRSSIQNQISTANTRYALESAEALDKGEQPKNDPRPKLNKQLEEIDVQLATLTALQVRQADTLDETITLEWLEAERDVLAGKLGTALSTLGALREQLDEVNGQRSLIHWLQDGGIKGGKAGALKSEAGLGALERELESTD
jgi:chromosome segregation ATPase